jgi:hypothetical protein
MYFIAYPEAETAIYTDHDDDTECDAVHEGWFCTRSANHTGLHEAVGLANEFCARWGVDVPVEL